MYVLIYFCEVTGFVDWLDKRFIYMRKVLNYAFAYECVHPCVCVCVPVVSVVVKHPVLPPCAVDGQSRYPIYYYYYDLSLTVLR